MGFGTASAVNKYRQAMARDAQLVEYDNGVMAFVVSGRRDPTEQRPDLRKLRDSEVDTRKVVCRIVDDDGEDEFVENDRHDFESHDHRPHPLTTVDVTVTQRPRSPHTLPDQ
jgi:hypothetical protein